METAHQFGHVLRNRRTAAGLSQEALADAAGLHPTYISLLENGHRMPTLDVVRRLGVALGTTATALVAEWEGVKLRTPR